MEGIFRKAPTFAEVMRAHPSQTTGFDYLRIGLAVVILIEHALLASIHGLAETMPNSWFGPIYRAQLGMFFALSGFLVAGSLLRTNLPHFLALRIFRIVPALAVEVGLTAAVIGGCFTVMPLSEYISSPYFWQYFLNIIGIMHYTLPGVFDGEIINYQLWTIPVEFECYLTLVVLSLLGLIANRKLFTVILVSVIASLTIFALMHDAVKTGPAVPSWALVLSFLCGVFGFLFKEEIPHSKYLSFLSIAAAYAILKAPNLVFLAPIPVAYFTVYVGLLRLPRLPLGDLSYGVYLYHYPVLQAIYHLSNRAMSPVLLVPLSLLATGLFASLSWFFVEKPILSRKRLLLSLIDKVWVRSTPGPRMLRKGA